MKKKHFLRILEKYRRGKATEEEQRFLEAYYDLFESESGMEDLNKEEKERLKQGIKNDIQEQIIRKELRTAKVRKIHSLRKIAAVLLLLLVSGAVFYLIHTKKNTVAPSVAENNRTPQEAIHPGGNKAVLTLANGQKVVLDSSSHKTFSSQSYINVSRDSGSLVYRLKKKPTDEIQYNTLSIPRGGEYKLVLSDGTKVWLNAESTITYPVCFNKADRKVRITGEAYFEVASEENHPFKVQVDESEIQVLGTHFNVMAYEKEGLKATLAEGSVRLVSGSAKQILKPGEQATVLKHTIDVKKVNIDKVLAWKNDLFYFDHTNIKVIMNELSRWYDIDVVYERKELENLNFSGVISRYADIADVLKRLSLTETVHFKIDNQTIRVVK